MKRSLMVALLLSALAAQAALPPTAGPEALRFKVFLDQREIGYHQFNFSGDDSTRTIETEADFRVRLLFVDLFRYEHRNKEIWRDGCLQQIDSNTRSNDKRFAVSGVRSGPAFIVESAAGGVALEDCVRTFAYWDRATLAGSRLLNSQTGEYLDVELSTLPAGSLEVGGREMAVDRYRLTARGMDIELAYAAESGEWLALDSTVKGGRKLRYRRDLDTTPMRLSRSGGGNR